MSAAAQELEIVVDEALVSAARDVLAETPREVRLKLVEVFGLTEDQVGALPTLGEAHNGGFLQPLCCTTIAVLRSSTLWPSIVARNIH